MKTRSALVLALFAVAGCVSVNVYLNFPALEQAMEKMEQEVRNPGGTPPSPDMQKMVGDDEDVQDVEIENEFIRAINEKRSKRFPEIEKLFDAGVLAEGHDCLIILHAPPRKAPERKRAQELTDEENSDRRRLLTEIMKANKIRGPENEEKVKRGYFKVLRKLAKSHWFIEYEPGKIVPKKDIPKDK